MAKGGRVWGFGQTLLSPPNGFLYILDTIQAAPHFG